MNDWAFHNYRFQTHALDAQIGNDYRTKNHTERFHSCKELLEHLLVILVRNIIILNEIDKNLQIIIMRLRQKAESRVSVISSPRINSQIHKAVLLKILQRLLILHLSHFSDFLREFFT
jgi:hypothetical protein